MNNFQNQHAQAVGRALTLESPDIVDGAWHWVRFDGLDGMTEWTPAQRQGNHWNSVSFRGIPMRSVEVGPALAYLPAYSSAKGNL